MAKDKARYFTFLLYPESIPEDWEEHFDSVKIREPLTIVNTSGELIVIPYENISHIKFSYIYDTE